MILRSIRWAIPLAAMGAMIVVGAGSPSDQPSIDEGRLLYRVYCDNCHGQSGRGDGPTARLLTIKPADLTRLSRRNGGEFPADQVARKIDGRDLVGGHGDKKMPIWGLSMQEMDQDSNQDRNVRVKIRHLIRFLESIQDGRAN